MNNEELYHHGILGMKWGRRRFQNPDGSLTPAGKKRYSDGDDDKERSKTAKKMKVSRKHVDKLYKALNGTGFGRDIAKLSLASKLHKEDYAIATELINRGQLGVATRTIKNYKDKTVDIFLKDMNTPVMRARYEDAENFVVDFVDKNGSKNAEAFMKYLREHSN